MVYAKTAYTIMEEAIGVNRFFGEFISGNSFHP